MMEVLGIISIVVAVWFSLKFGPQIQFMEFSSELLKELDNLGEDRT